MALADTLWPDVPKRCLFLTRRSEQLEEQALGLKRRQSTAPFLTGPLAMLTICAQKVLMFSATTTWTIVLVVGPITGYHFHSNMNSISQDLT